VIKAWPDDYTELRFGVPHNMLPQSMAVRTMMTSDAPVEVHNLKGGVCRVAFEHFFVADALRLFVAEVTRGGLAVKNAQTALKDVSLQPGESWDTALNRLVQLTRTASVDPDRLYLAEEHYFWMTRSSNDLYWLMDRAIALCVPQPTDRQTFVSILIERHQLGAAQLKLHRMDTHALSSPVMGARGEL